MSVAPQALGPEVYQRVFEGHHEGTLILADLTARFFDIEVYVAGPDGERETSRRAAQREVVRFILRKLSQVPEDLAPPPEPPAY